MLAFGRVEDDGDRDLCLGGISGDGMNTGCIDEPKIAIGSAIHWAPNGKSILAGGVETASGKFGVVRWKSKKAFSADPGDWGKGRFVTDTSKPGEGVKEAALSPDGRRLALVSNVGGGPFELVLGQARRLRADERQGDRRARLQGLVAAGQPRARGHPGRRRLRRERRLARARAGGRTRASRSSSRAERRTTRCTSR